MNKHFLLFFIFITNLVLGQEIDYCYKHYSLEDGLPSNTVYNVTQDKNGYLWFGTDAGICRFDGNNFKTFTTKDGLPSNDVFSVVCDHINRLWLITFSNKIVFIQNDKIYTEKNNKTLEKLKFKSRVTHLVEDDNNTLWILENGSNLYQLVDTNFKQTENFKSKLKNISHITKLKKGVIFNSGISVLFDYKTGLMQSHNNSNLLCEKVDDLLITDSLVFILNKNNLSKIPFKDYVSQDVKKQYEIWHSQIFLNIINNKYLFAIKQEGTSIYNFQSLKFIKTILKNKNISSIYADNVGNIYFTSLKEGIFVIRNINTQNIFYSAEPNIMSIHASRNNLYIGNKNNRLDIFENYQLKYRKEISKNYANSGTGGYRILKILKYENKVYFIGDKAIYFFDHTNLTTECIYNVHPNLHLGAFKDFTIYDNYIYVTTNKYLLKISLDFKSMKSIILNGIQSICKFQNQIYASYLNNIFLLNKDSLIKQNYYNIINSRIVNLLETPSQLIIATAEEGLYKLENNEITPYLPISEKLSSNNCNKLLIYNSILYLATKKGITVIDSNRKVLRYIYEPDGLASNNVNDLTIQNDTLYAATDKGVSIIDLKHLPTHKFDGYFLNPTIVGKDTLWQNRLDGSAPIAITSYDDVPIKFIINSINFSTDGKFLHHYRIASIDSTWSITEDKFIDIKNLAPGEYVLETFATNSYGLRSQVLNQKLTIQPYFFQRKMVRLGILIGICFILFLLYKRRTRYLISKEKSKQELETKISTLELASWRAKINPHFIFNALNAMQSIFINKDFELANTYLANFSNVLRKTIVNSGEILTTVSHEINYLESYLSLEEIKRNTNFSYTIEVENQIIKNYYIPSMVIQPIIENCLKHGIKAKKNGHIGIHFTVKNEILFCTITDNGVGFGNSDNTNSTSKGNLLIQEKLEIIERLIRAKTVFYSQNRLDDAQAICGTETIFQFPIQKTNITLHDSDNN